MRAGKLFSEKSSLGQWMSDPALHDRAHENIFESLTPQHLASRSVFRSARSARARHQDPARAAAFPRGRGPLRSAAAVRVRFSPAKRALTAAPSGSAAREVLRAGK